MNEIKDKINILEYDYNLPDDRIARYPPQFRDSSKLLLYMDGKIEKKVFNETPDLLGDKYHLVFNDTRVIHARILFRKNSGAAIEIFLLEPYIPSEYIQSFNTRHECVWKCLVGNAKKWKEEILFREIDITSPAFKLTAEKTGQEGNYFLIRFSWSNSSHIFSDIIEQAGSTPIPPYLNRYAEISDSSRYQTVYSKHEGSVAAPTAGLHFTDEVLRMLENKGARRSFLTLHVGAGTFVPVKTENAREHIMHTEHIYLNRKSIEDMYLSDRKFIAVGTTSVRTMESLYHIAGKLKNEGGGTGDQELFLDQWEAYSTDMSMTRKEALEYILIYMDKTKVENLKLSTRIMIVPGYKFRMTEGIITNFHQPASTLLLLIAAFIGEDWRKVYNYALENDFRFLSYGDSSLLMKDRI
jgi:S-adenosylmethionine:tRNA ribosyltransferase-isomerase